MHNSLFINKCMLHYYPPRHVSSINMPIFMRTNCIHTASGIVALCKRLHSTLVESGLQSALNQCTVQPFTEGDDTRCCVNTIFPPEDGHVNARNKVHCVLCRRLQRAKIPDAVWIQFFLLKMGMLMLETQYTVYCADVYRERRYQMLCEYNFSSWRWAR